MEEAVTQGKTKLTKKNVLRALLLSTLLILIVIFGLKLSEPIFKFSQMVFKDNDSIFTTRSPLETGETRNVSKKTGSKKTDQKCTFTLFRRYYAENNYLPAGSWRRCFDSNLNKTTSCYQPQICKYKYPQISSEYVQQCLAEANVSSIMSIGDSNAMRYFSAITKLLGRCQVISRESLKGGGFIPDIDNLKKYAGNLQEYLSVHFRFCSGCAGQQVKCKFPVEHPNKTIILAEHIAMTMLFDDSVQFSPPTHKVAESHLQEMWAITWQELVLRYLLKDRYPDVFLILTPFVHMKFMKLGRFLVEMESFHSMVKYYIPSTTKIVYMPTFSEFEGSRPAKAEAYVNKTYENMLATEKIDHFNHIMFSVLKNEDIQFLGLG